MKNRIPILLAIFLMSFINYIASGDSNLSGNINVWWNIYEQNENGVKQAGTKDDAADVTSGFNVKQARLTYDYNKNAFNAKTQIRFEERVALLDCYISWQPSDLIQIYTGQMKVPSTYEALEPDERLDFITRSSLSKNLTDWSLSRPPYYSPFYGNRSDYRDMGVAVKGGVSHKNTPDLFSYFLMIGNGLGANLAIGGQESKEYVLSNNFGDFFYGARLEFSPINLVKLGAHYSFNKHDNILYNDNRTALDFKRHSWSADACFKFSLLKLIAMYGEGEIDDDYFHADLTNLKYSGWETKLLADIIKDKLQLGVRFDRYTEKYFNEVVIEYDDVTFGINYIPVSNVRIQLNYTTKTTDSNSEPETDNDILFLNFQCYFDTK